MTQVVLEQWRLARETDSVFEHVTRVSDPAAGRRRPDESEVNAARAFLESQCARPVRVMTSMGYEILVRCGSRLRARCRSCSDLASNEWGAIMRDSFWKEDGSPVTGYRWVWVTLTGPSFGSVHRVPGTKQRQRYCKCGVRHRSDRDAGLRGVPVDPEKYDHRGQISWNLAQGQLWNATLQNLRRRYPDLAFCSVLEWQSRGCLHRHVLLRFPDSTDVDPAEIHAILDGSRSVDRTTGELFEWGEQIDVQRVRADESTAQLLFYARKLVQYSVKSLGTVGPASHEEAAQRHWQMLDEAARVARCGPECKGGAYDARVNPRGLCRKPAHRQWGFRGHVVTVSRASKSRGTPGWSLSGLTRQKQRAARYAYWLAKNGKKTDEELKAEAARLIRARSQAESLIAAYEKLGRDDLRSSDSSRWYSDWDVLTTVVEQTPRTEHVHDCLCSPSSWHEYGHRHPEHPLWAEV